MAARTGEYNEKARGIIRNNAYMILATSNKNAAPWASPVFYAYDKKYNFYFLSAIDSRHAENLLENPKVGIAIFDSGQKIGTSDGIQMEGSVKVVEGKEVENAIELYSKRLFPESKMKGTDRYDPKSYLEPAEFRFFKVTPSLIYVTGVDRRVEVDLLE
jgi:uncharacterized protein YhbP (UPF0306 family)